MEYAHFMNTLFDLWFEKDNAVFSIGFFDDILRWLLGGTPSVCHLRNGCYRHVKVDYNGDLVPCDTFLGENFVFGNILRQDLSEIVTDKPYQTIYPSGYNSSEKLFGLLNGYHSATVGARVTHLREILRDIRVQCARLVKLCLATLLQ